MFASILSGLVKVRVEIQFQISSSIYLRRPKISLCFTLAREWLYITMKKLVPLSVSLLSISN